MSKTRTTIYLSDDLHKKVKSLCALKGTNLSIELEEYVKCCVERNYLLTTGYSKSYNNKHEDEDTGLHVQV